MNYLQLLQIIPAIINAIKAVESAVPVGGQGKEKLDAVLATNYHNYRDIGEIVQFDRFLGQQNHNTLTPEKKRETIWGCHLQRKRKSPLTLTPRLNKMQPTFPARVW